MQPLRVGGLKDNNQMVISFEYLAHIISDKSLDISGQQMSRKIKKKKNVH